MHIYTRRGADWTSRFPRIVSAVRKVKATSLLIDGEGVVCDKDGMPSFALLHSRNYDKEVSLIAFDLLELEGAAARSNPLLNPKGALERLLSRVKTGIELNGHLESVGPKGAITPAWFWDIGAITKVPNKGAGSHLNRLNPRLQGPEPEGVEIDPPCLENGTLVVRLQRGRELVAVGYTVRSTVGQRVTETRG